METNRARFRRTLKTPVPGGPVPGVVFDYSDAYSVFDWGRMPDTIPGKGSALACVPAAAQCTAYVADHKSNSVAVIDTWTDRVVDVIPVQFQPLAVAVTPNGAFAYVTNLVGPLVPTRFQ